MRTRYRYDADLDAVVEIRGNYFEGRPDGPSIISDDVGVGVNGLRHMPSGKMLDSKSAHYRENRARGLEPVGNETNFAVKRDKASLNYYEGKVNDTLQQIQSNYNGTADRLAAERMMRGDRR